MRDRAREVYPPQTTVEDTLKRDPRLMIWKHAAEHYRERPLTGYGYGRLILQDELRADTGDPLLTHAHNMFVSQALQTGAIGVALLVVLLATVRGAVCGHAPRAATPRCGGSATLGLAILAGVRRART